MMRKSFRLNYIVDPYIKSLSISSSMVAEIHNINIEDTDIELASTIQERVNDIVKNPDLYIFNNPILDSYKELVQKVGRSPKKFPPSAKNLIQSAIKRKSIPQINNLVDAYNYIVLKTFLSIGAHDLDLLGSTITFRKSDGDEPFRAIGSDKQKKTIDGDYVYGDENHLLAWLDSKDSDHAKVSDRTKNVLIVIQGTHTTEEEYIQQALTEVCQLITKYCGGEFAMKHI